MQCFQQQRSEWLKQPASLKMLVSWTTLPFSAQYPESVLFTFFVNLFKGWWHDSHETNIYYKLQYLLTTHSETCSEEKILPRKTNIDHPLLSLTMFQRNFKQILFLDSIKTPAVSIQSLNNSHQPEWALRIAILKETFHKAVIQN